MNPVQHLQQPQQHHNKMAQTVLITLVIAGTDTGPFDLYSDIDGYAAPFEFNISKASLTAGYLSISVPNGATIVRVKSKGLCPTFVDIPITGTIYSTTTTTTSFPPTTSTTTTASGGSTTSTTTTSVPPLPKCYDYNVLNQSGNQQAVQWTDCCSGFVSYEFIDSGTSINVCSRTEPSGIGLIITGGTVECQNQCTTSTTTTTSGTTSTTTTSSCKCYMIQDADGPDGATGTYTDCNGEIGLWIINEPLGRTFVCTNNPASIVALSGTISIFLITPSDPLYINCSC